jgi:GH24 family phage-related lysozyme (muramidase)
MKVPFVRPKHLSKKGAEFIGRSEGLRLTPYNDAVGHATIGYGHLMHYGNVTAADRAKYGYDPVKKVYKKPMTVKQAINLLITDAERYARPLATHAKKRKWKLNQPQFDALVSFSFNVGTGWLDDSGLERTLTRVSKDGKVGDLDKAAVRRELDKWDVAGGHHLPGLLARREREAHLFATGQYR